MACAKQSRNLERGSCDHAASSAGVRPREKKAAMECPGIPSPLPTFNCISRPAQTFTNMPRRYSHFIFAMTESGIFFGQAAVHSPMFVQLPKPSASI